MASIRHGPRYGSARSDERTQAPTRPTLGAGAGVYRSAVSADNSTSSQPRRAMESSRTQPQESSSISRTPSSSRIPQVQTTTRRTPAPRQTTTRPPLSHQDKPWSSGFSNSLGYSSRSASSSAIPTGSLSSARQTEELKPRPVRNVLRRKSANLAQETVKLRTQSGSGPSRETDSPASITRSLASPDSQLDRSLTDSPAEIRIAMQIDLPTTMAQTVKIYPELDRYRDANPAGSGYTIEVPYPLSTHDLPPPTPLFSGTSSQPSAYSGSPSTRFSGSPGPGPYSRDTTPTTSIPSHSPGLVAPLRLPAPRVRQNSPAHHQQSSRPPVTRRRAGSVPNEVDSISADPHGLAAVREVLNSSSSNSTVRDGDRKKAAPAAITTTAASSETGSETKRKKKRLEAAPPPSPPPRKSSTKFKESPLRDSPRDARESSPSKSARDPARPIMASSAASRSTPPTMARAHTATPAVTSPRGVPPARPSRDGTPDLQSQISLPIPVVQSNLSSSSLSERRQSLPLGPGSRSAPSNLTHSIRSATPSSQPDRFMQPTQSRLPVGREPTPALPRLDTRRPSHSGSTTSRTPSPNVSGFRSRFPLFGRRAKTAPEAVTQVADQKEKAVRKGPAAGTGHEGYGRIGMSHHRRRSSSLARGVGGTMSSQESLERSLSDDPFLLERMKPVVIAGGDVVQNHNVGADLGRTESNQSLPGGFSRTGSDMSLAPPPGDRTTLWPSPLPRNVTAATASLGGRRPSDSSDSEALAMRSTLAFRRSIHKMKDGADAAMRIPKPIVTRTQGVTSPALTSIDTTIMTDDSAVEAPAGGAFRAIKGPAPSAGSSKKLTKRAKSPRRWNFFGRSTSQPAVATKSPEPPKPVVAVKVAPPKAAAFYTMDFSEQEDNDGGDTAEGMWDANLLAVPSPQPQPQSQPQPPQNQIPTTRRPSVTRTTTNEEEQLKRGGVVEPLEYREMSPEPQPPQWTETPLVATPEPVKAAEPAEPEPQPTVRRVGRPSRLPQVGRIPKVVNSRPEQTSPKSFSRPFNRISVRLAPRGEIKDANSVAKGPSPVKPLTPEPIQPTPPTQPAEQASTAATAFDSRFRGSRELTADLANIMTEFLAFSPRKNSQSTTCTTTSTSSCSSGIVSYADATAVVPAPNAPLVEDEIWGEYDDLFGDETLKAPPSAGSSHGTPFHLEHLARRVVEPPLESPTLKQPVRLPAIDATATGSKRPSIISQVEIEREKVPIASSIYSTDITGPLNEAIETGVIPVSSPFSVSEFVSGYGDGSQKASPTKAPSIKSPVIKAAVASKPPTSLRRNSTPVSSSSPRRLPHQKRASDASGASSLLSELDISSPLSQVNLRVGSMTVSKWLTFGHVLFSPVRDELVPEAGSSEKSLKRHSILVVDGLGNDDWSFYAAETYPAATFFNLSPRAPLATLSSTSSGSFPLTPPNHHQIQYMSHLDKFPFGPESFTAVVYRFPAAAPESHFRNIIAESRRVLKPGGYMELSILDVDLNNMGNRSRRVVRRLKERIHAVKPDTCLGSTADLLLRLMGRKGFVDIKSCRVGVPVASRLAASSSSGSSGDGAGAGPSPLARGAGAPRRKKDDRSLAEMMRDESPVADESITKMVSKVGRWWFSRCYEPGVGAGAAGFGGSVWNDKLLLAECQEWGTSLKLMVCHARVPDGRARVASI
ncbi:hypothetical protein RB595_003732 [Gaeumannomyces hyphopodioides]